MTRLTINPDKGPVENDKPSELTGSEVTVVIFNGPAGSGKDTLVEALCADKELNAVACSFKGPMFKVAIALSGLDESEFMKRYNNRELKDKPWGEFNGMTAREFFIEVSEKWVKPLLGQDRFGYLATKAVTSSGSDLVLFSDGGFESEIDKLKEAFGTDRVILVRLYRDGFTFEGDSRNYVNPGDCLCLDLKLIDGEIELAVKALKRFIV